MARYGMTWRLPSFTVLSLIDTSEPRVTRKVQAMPLHRELVKAFVAFGFLEQDPDFALAVYVGFVALLRGCEIFNLALSDCQQRGPDQVCLILRGC